MNLGFYDLLIILFFISYFLVFKYIAFFLVLFLFLKLAERSLKNIGKKKN